MSDFAMDIAPENLGENDHPISTRYNLYQNGEDDHRDYTETIVSKHIDNKYLAQNIPESPAMADTLLNSKKQPMIP